METLARRIERRDRAARVKRKSDIPGMRLAYWNYESCPAHETPKPDCEFQRCGGDLFPYQHVGVLWLYLVERGLLVDNTGLGKLVQILGLLALMKERNKLDRAVIVCQAPAVEQWVEEAQRWTPRLHVVAGIGSPAERRLLYQSEWDVLVLSYQVMLRDEALLRSLGTVSVGVADDVDPIRTWTTKTAKAFKFLASSQGIFKRVYILNATPLQIRLEELYSSAVPVGGMEIFGPYKKFEQRHCVTERRWFWITRKNGKKEKIHRLVVTGYKNMEEFRRLIEPIALRRTYRDVKGVHIPEIAPPENVWLELSPRQRRKYDELQKGVLRLIEEQGEKVKLTNALTQFTYGSEICAGLPALGEKDGAGASVKLDWLMDKLTGDWIEEKVVVFSRFKGTIRAFHERCEQAGVGVATVWGDETRPEVRQAEVKRFWQDPACRAIIGTSAIERSLNLQVANIVVNFDTLLNPARMLQILGRTRRVGSAHSTIYVFNLLTRDTQEERYLEILRKRQALADFVWNDETGLYEKLSSLELLKLIQP